MFESMWAIKRRITNKYSDGFSLSFLRNGTKWNECFLSSQWIGLLSMSGTFSCLISEAGTTSSLHLDFNSKNKGTEIFYHGYLFPNIKKLSDVYFMKLSLILYMFA